jgi:hypothetical protein
MRSFWEQTGVLGPIYRLLAKDLNDDDIALKLTLPEEKVRGCIAWMLHFLKLKRRIVKSWCYTPQWQHDSPIARKVARI